MKFILNKIDKEKIDKLIETNYYNDEIANYINEFVIGNIYPLETEENIKIDKLDINKYINNPYYKCIDPNQNRIGKYNLYYKKYNQNEVFIYDEIDVDENDYFLINYKLGYFNSLYKYLAIDYKNTTWMSIIPHEINTIKNTNRKNRRIYVLGLGLGYFPYINEDNYDEIIIIDKDKNIIDLFNKNIFPLFNNKNKYKIINNDVFNVINDIDINDDVFVDLYHNENDGLYLYYKLKHLIKNKNTIYWIEKSILASFRHLFINLIEEELYHQGEFDYSKSNNFIDEVINKLHNHFIDYEIKDYASLHNLLRDSNLKELISIL